MKRRAVFLGALSAMMMISGACASRTNRVPDKPASVKVAPPRHKAPLPLVEPARWVLTEGMGVSYDERGMASPIAGRDAALVAGKRMLLDGGVMLQSAASPELLVGFHSLPARLGGGIVFWSDSRTYHASSFLGKLEPFADIGASGGVRPWFGSFVLRTSIGLLEVEAQSFAVRRGELARFSEALSFDGKLGVRLDAVGRTEVSIDGGGTFRDLTAERGSRFVPAIPDLTGKLLLSPTNRRSLTFQVDETGALVAFDPTQNGLVRLDRSFTGLLPEEPAYTRKLAAADLPVAVAVGATLGERVLTMRETTLRVLSAKTGNFIVELPLSGVTEPYSRCQPVALKEAALLACRHASGAHLLALRGSPTTVQLAATFPEPKGFVAGLGERFAFLGRCGSMPPSTRDFPGYVPPEDQPTVSDQDTAAPPAPEPEPEVSPDAPLSAAAGEAAVCVRLTDGTWIERRIDGVRERDKYYFLPGDHGQVTVVVLDKPPTDKPAPVEGVRFIYVDPATPALRKETFHTAYQPPDQAPWRTVMRDMWLDEKDGSVHGWVHLPHEQPEEIEAPDLPDGMGLIGLLSRFPLAGVHIQADGSVEVHPLPEGVDDVVVGGPYAFARAKVGETTTYYESRDGGRTFVAVSGPLLDELPEPSGVDVRACSPAGCALGGGLVRLGWGSAAAATNAAADTAETNSLNPKGFDPDTVVPSKRMSILRCRIDEKGPAAGSSEEPLITTQTVETEVGSRKDRQWTVLATAPFEVKPAYPVLFEGVSTDRVTGEPILVLRASATRPADLLLHTNEFLFDLSSGPKRKPTSLAAEARGTIAAELGQDQFLLLDSRSTELRLVKEGAARLLMQLDLIPEPTQRSLTLARRAGTGDDVLGVGLFQRGSGEILLGELDLGRAVLGPLRTAANLHTLDKGSACVRGARDYRMVVNDSVSVALEPLEEGRIGALGSTLISIGTGRGCMEAAEVRLGNDSTVVVRFSGGDASGYPAMVHERGRSLKARCRAN